jgi:hypothetical protein
MKMKIAEDYEKEKEFEKAIIEYKNAAAYYEMEKSGYQGYKHSCMLKQADIMCNMNHKDAYEESRQVKFLFKKLKLTFIF